MNMAGKLQREGTTIDVRHVAEVLAGMTRYAGHRRASKRHESTRDDGHRRPRRISRTTPARRSPIADLQSALKFVEVNFIARRKEVADRLPEFEALRDSARDIKNHTLAHLDLYLEAYEQRVTAQGGHVHYAVTADDARADHARICAASSARRP